MFAQNKSNAPAVYVPESTIVYNVYIVYIIKLISRLKTCTFY